MENKEEKLHLMISSVAYQETSIAKAYEKTVEKYNFPAVRTMQDAINNNAPSIITVKKQLQKRDGSSRMISDVLKLMVAKTVRAFNIARNIEPQQIVDLVETIEQEFYFLKLSEVHLILRDAKMGKYGKLYERIDEPTVIGWFQDYVDKRTEHFMAENDRIHDSITSGERSRKYDDFVVNMRRNIQREEDDRIKNIAHAMAKKMNANQQNNNPAPQPPVEPTTEQESE
jgi:hypothetical protein